MVRLTDRPDMTLDVYRGRKTTIQQQLIMLGGLLIVLVLVKPRSLGEKTWQAPYLSVGYALQLCFSLHMYNFVGLMGWTSGAASSQ